MLRDIFAASNETCNFGSRPNACCLLLYENKSKETFSPSAAENRKCESVFFSCRDCIFPGERSHTFLYGLTKTLQTCFPEWWRKFLRWFTVRPAGLWCLFTIFCSSFWVVKVYSCDKGNRRVKNLTLTKKNINEKSLWSTSVSTFCTVFCFLNSCFSRCGNNSCSDRDCNSGVRQTCEPSL